MVERIYELILPPNVRDDQVDLRVVRFIALISFSATIFHLIMAPILAFYFGEMRIAGWLLVGAVLHGVGLLILRAAGRPQLSGLVLVAEHVILLLVMIMLYFPARAVFYVWLPYVIMLATFSMGRRYGAILVGGLGALIVQLEVWMVQGLALPQNTFSNPYALSISLSLALVMTGLIAWLFEMTHRAAEQRLYTSEQKLRLHVEQTPLAVVTCSLEGMVTEWNPAAERMFGYQREEAVGKYIGELIQPPASSIEPSGVEKAFWDVLRGEEHYHQISHNRTKDGVDVFCEWFTTPLVEPNGTIVGVTSLAMDVGERIRAEDALRASEARFRRLASQSPDFIAIYDWTVERIVYINRDTIFGYDWGSIGDLPAILNAIVPEDRQRVYESWREMEFAPEGMDTNVNEFRVVSASGGIEWLRSRETVLTRNSHGLPTQLLATITVVTDEKRYQEDLRIAKEEAEAMARIRSQFLANMSHEIRTPMNGIIGMTSLLLDGEYSAEQRDFIETIRRSGESLLSIINEILDFSKIESGRMELEMQSFDLLECVEGAVELLAAQAAQKGLELGYWVAADVPRMVVGDVTRLRQVLVNLLGNAVKFTEQGEVWVDVTCVWLDQADAGHVMFDGSPAEQVSSSSMAAHVEIRGNQAANQAVEQGVQLRFAVRDTGIGIQAEQIPRLFNAFSQLDNSTTRRYGGTGLGLAISRRLAELMGGTMWVESEYWQGSTFFFTVKVRADRQSVAGKPDDSLDTLRDLRLLFVDGHALLRRVVTDYGKRWGVHVETAAGAEAALELARRQHVWDVVMMASVLPDRKGLSLIQELRAVTGAGSLPVVVVAKLGETTIRARAEEAGATGLLYKPLKMGDLRQALCVQAGGQPPEDTEPRLPVLDGSLGREHPLSVLLAEDNVVNQKVALLTLERLGYRADVAASGIEVLEALSRQPYGLILMDVHMPEMDGIEATKRILAGWPADEHPYIVAMTAAAMQEDRDRCHAAGMHDFISKPVKVEELVSALLRAEAWLVRESS